MNSRIQQIEKKIRDLCPELMKLKSGCYIRHSGIDSLEDIDFCEGFFDSWEGTPFELSSYLVLRNGVRVNYEDFCAVGEVVPFITKEWVEEAFVRLLESDKDCTYKKARESLDEMNDSLFFTWETGKPLKQQPEEVIEFLDSIF